MKSMQFRRNLTIILSTLIAVIFLYFLYAQVYMKNREEQMIQTRFRVLDQMGENLVAKIESYKSNAEIYISTARDSLTKYEYKLIDTVDSKAIIKKTMENFNKVYNQDLIFRKVNMKPNFNEIMSFPDTIIFTIDSIEFSLPKQLILKNIDRTDVFEKILIMDTSEIIYSSFSRDIKLVVTGSKNKGTGNKGSIIKFTSANDNDTLFLPGQKEKNAAFIHSNKSYNVSLSDGEYKLFLKPVKIGQFHWFIGGLVGQKDFQRYKQSIAPGWIIILSIILLLIMISLPFVKLIVMSKIEMLGNGTVMYAGLAFFLGASFLVFFLFFKAYNIHNVEVTDQRLEILSNTIKSELLTEMKSVALQLEATDNHYENALKNTINESDANIQNNKSELYITDIFDSNKTGNYEYYKYYDYIFWLDSSGQAIAQITPFSIREKMINYAHRDYFKKSNEWPFVYDNKKVEKNRFRMESIVSTTSGEYKVAFSRPSASGPSVIVMTGRFYSLIDPIIPAGFKFCIIDESGKTWFHSNKYQNLGENFISECNDNRQLKAACYAKIASSLNVSYYNTKHRIHITPIKGLPLSLVTMYDLRSEYSYQAQVFITTLVLICFLFIFILLQIIIILVLKHFFHHDLVTGKFQLDFIALRKTNKFDYQHLILYFIVALLLYCTIMPFVKDIAAIIAIYTLVASLFALFFYHLYSYRLERQAIIYYKIINAILMTCIIIYIDYMAGNFETENQNDLILSFIPLVIYLAIIFFYKRFKWLKTNEQINKPEKKQDINYSYLIFLMVILFGVGPILKFFDIAADLENNIHTRYGQLELASSMEKRNEGFIKYYERVKNKNNSTIREIQADRREEGVFTKFWNETHWLKNIKKETGKQVEEFEYLVTAFRPLYKDEFSVSSKYLLVNTDTNRPFNWLNYKDSLVFTYNIPSDNDIFAIKSSVPESNIFNPFWKVEKMSNSYNIDIYGLLKDVLVYLILFVILFLLLKLITFTIRKTFGLSLLEDYTVSGFKSRVMDHIDKNLPVMVVNPSAFLGLKILEENISRDFDTIDFNWNYPKSSVSRKTRLIKDLFKVYQDPEILADKLKIILDCIQSSGKLIILLDINPETVINYYKEKIEISKKPDPKAVIKPEEDLKYLKKNLELLNDLMKKMIVLFVPVIYPHFNFAPGRSSLIVYSLEEKTQNLEILSRLELGASDYLVTLKDQMTAYSKFIMAQNLNLNEKKQHIISRISEMAGKYYRSLLDTCSIEEKIVLFDLAVDSIANVKNKPAIIRLLRRGLILQGDDSIELMNNSFRLFLLNNYIKQDKEYLKALDNKPGDWASYRIAIYVVIAALFIFIFISNQEFLQNLNKLFITLGASITGIISLLNLVGRKAKES